MGYLFHVFVEVDGRFLLVHSGSWERHTNAESSTYLSSILSILISVGVVSVKYMYLVAMDHRIGSRTAAHIEGRAQLSCPVLSILLRAFL